MPLHKFAPVCCGRTIHGVDELLVLIQQLLLIVPLLDRRGGGAIVNVATIVELASNPNRAAYCASTVGRHALSRVVSVECGCDGIRCNSVAPGWIDTELNAEMTRPMTDIDLFRVKTSGIHPVERRYLQGIVQTLS